MEERERANLVDLVRPSHKGTLLPEISMSHINASSEFVFFLVVDNSDDSSSDL